MYLILGEVDRKIEESNENKNLVFASIDENKEVLKIYTEFWNEIKNEIKTINGEKQVNIKKISWKSNLTQMIICFWIEYLSSVC